MLSIRVVSDLDQCERRWRALVGKEQHVFDIWDVRMCFQHAFNRPPAFVTAREGNELVGLLPLSHIVETGVHGIFPGETWKHKTWLEGNRIFAKTDAILREMMAALEGPMLLRYLEGDCLPHSGDVAVDEIGYLFFPSAYDYSFAAYQSRFSGKSLRKMHKEIAALEEQGVEIRYDERADVERLFHMNLEAFGDSSYFSDPRFLHAFERLVSWLHDHDALLVTTVRVGGKIAAIDIGALWNQSYTVLAGGVSPGFPGVAKLINFHHLERACKEHFERVDFLCGDFNWKERFRLTPRPLHKLELSLNSTETKAVRSVEYECA